MTSLELTIHEVAGAPVITVRGSVDLATVATLRGRLLEAVTTHTGETIVVDLDEVVSLDDVGLGVLLGLAGRARELGGDIRLVCSPGRLRDRLARTGADRAIDVSPHLFAGSATIYHLALPHDWEEATRSGEYAVSSRGRTLAEEGFVHCSYEHQLVDTANRFFADVPEVVLLSIDPARVDAAVVEEAADGDELFPHVYGAIPLAAVTATRPWRRGADGRYILAIP